MTALDHVLALVLVVGVPLYGWWSWPRLKRRLSSDEPGVRPRTYWLNIALQWTLVGLACAAWITAGRPWADLGFAAEMKWQWWTMLAAAVLLAAGLTTQYVVLTRTEPGRQRLREELEAVEPFVPHDRRELRHFAALAVTAGICEEILYRGFLIWYATRLTGTTLIGIAAAVLVTSVVFSAAHLYQGPRHAAQILVLALVGGTLYVVSGSLWIVMALHTYVDLASGLVAVSARRGAPDTRPADP